MSYIKLYQSIPMHTITAIEDPQCVNTSILCLLYCCIIQGACACWLLHQVHTNLYVVVYSSCFFCAECIQWLRIKLTSIDDIVHVNYASILSIDSNISTLVIAAIAIVVYSFPSYGAPNNFSSSTSCVAYSVVSGDQKSMIMMVANRPQPTLA